MVVSMSLAAVSKRLCARSHRELRVPEPCEQEREPRISWRVTHEIACNDKGAGRGLPMGRRH